MSAWVKDVSGPTPVRIGGVTKLSTVDYPGELAAVIYVKGCNLRCPYCHNRALVEDEGGEILPSMLMSWLDAQRDRLTAVVISGGEPLLYESWVRGFAQQMHKWGYKVKLDTNCMLMTQSLAQSLQGYVDRIAVDVKAPLEHGVQMSSGVLTADAWNRYLILAYNNLAYANNIGELELRTTVHKSLLSPQDISIMRTQIALSLYCQDRDIAPPWYLQLFRQADCFDRSLNEQENYTPKELFDIARSVGAMTRGCGEYDDESRKLWEGRLHEPEVVPEHGTITLSPDGRVLGVDRGELMADTGDMACRSSE